MGDMGERVAALEAQMNGVCRDLKSLHRKVDSLQGKWFGAGCALIVILLGIIGWLVTRGAPWVEQAGGVV